MRKTRRSKPEQRARVGERIKLAATQAGLTLKELAEQAGSTPTLIYQYVRGVIVVPAPMLERIAEATGVPVAFFDPDMESGSLPALPLSESVASAGAAEADMRTRIQAELRHLHSLATAQDFPKRDRAGYQSTLEQMLALARALEYQDQEAWILWRLGRIRMENGDLDEARRDLLAAREMFAARGMGEYHFHATQDLAAALIEMGAFEAAQTYLEETAASPDLDVRWRALLSLGSLRYRNHDFSGALRSFLQAAELLEQMDGEVREREAIPHLMSRMADIVRATGHYEEAMLLWSRCLQRALVDRKSDIFLESLMEVAQCCQALGRIGEAKERLNMAVVLAGFLFEDEARLGVARALLSDVLLAMGSLEEARENARLSQRIADRVRAARPTILSALALAETSLAAGHWQEALRHAQEALTEAERTGRTREVAQARELCARAWLRGYEDARAAGEEAEARRTMAQALREADVAVEMAVRTDSVKERVAAHLTRARCCLLLGDETAAEHETRAALELTENGAVGLNRLLGKEAQHLPALALTADLDLPSLFAEHKVDLPALEWQAHYLEGTLLARRLGPEAAFGAMREAAQSIARMLTDLTQTEAAAFQQRHPEVGAVLRDLQRYAITDSARQETAALLESMRLTSLPSRHPSLPSGSED
ncbi:MAG TPA: helix-turn-helix domain-containing protein [Chthonomonadaceae bacterium]|nr:helix-turn-helix domain-containing protein [Chthonomonadaceae bacterium]